MNRQVFFLAVAMCIMLIVVSHAEAKKGFYMGLGAAYNTVQGDFKGTSALQGGSEIIILPDVDNAVGVDLSVGYGITDAWAIELNWIGSDHTGTWAGLKGDVSFFSFSVNGKYNFQSSTTVQPYLLFGISGNALQIYNGAQNIYTGQVGDATLSGAGFNLGAGVDHYLTSHLSLNLGVLYRFVDYDQAEGIDTNGSIDDTVNGNGYSFLLSTAYHF